MNIPQNNVWEKWALILIVKLSILAENSSGSRICYERIARRKLWSWNSWTLRGGDLSRLRRLSWNWNRLHYGGTSWSLQQGKGHSAPTISCYSATLFLQGYQVRIIIMQMNTVGAGIPNWFEIPMVALDSVFQWYLVFPMVLMMALLSKTIGNQNKNAAILYGFPMVQFWNRF